MLKTVLYVSRSTIPQEDAQNILAGLVEKARAKNEQLGVSGALVFTGQRFAQCLEGPAEAVDRLMGDIAGDPRHVDVTVVEDRAIDRPAFDGWGLIYSGGSYYVDRHIKALLGEARGSDVEAARRLRELMLKLVQ